MASDSFSFISWTPFEVSQSALQPTIFSLTLSFSLSLLHVQSLALLPYRVLTASTSSETYKPPIRRQIVDFAERMATASATVSPVGLTATVATSKGSVRRKSNVNYITGMNAFGGLKAHNYVASLGVPVCTEESFAKVVSSLRSQGNSGRGGALSSTCDAVGEIFRIAAIMNGLVLVGVAVGFVLLRIEASIEEAE